MALSAGDLCSQCGAYPNWVTLYSTRNVAGEEYPLFPNIWVCYECIEWPQVLGHDEFFWLNGGTAEVFSPNIDTVGLYYPNDEIWGCFRHIAMAKYLLANDYGAF